MFISRHARERLEERLPEQAAAIIARLESTPGDPWPVAHIVARLPQAHGDRRRWNSNGDTVIAIAEGGEVVTIYLRRSWNQRLDRGGLGVHRVVDWTQQRDERNQAHPQPGILSALVEWR